MTNINTTRSTFFPNSKAAKHDGASEIAKSAFVRNSDVRSKEISDLTKNDAKVGISEAVKDFARIKKMVDQSPEINNADKIAKLKSQIQQGTYKIDYDALADKMLQSEF